MLPTSYSHCGRRHFASGRCPNDRNIETNQLLYWCRQYTFINFKYNQEKFNMCDIVLLSIILENFSIVCVTIFCSLHTVSKTHSNMWLQALRGHICCFVLLLRPYISATLCIPMYIWWSFLLTHCEGKWWDITPLPTLGWLTITVPFFPKESWDLWRIIHFING